MTYVNCRGKAHIFHSEINANSGSVVPATDIRYAASDISSQLALGGFLGDFDCPFCMSSLLHASFGQCDRGIYRFPGLAHLAIRGPSEETRDYREENGRTE